MARELDLNPYGKAHLFGGDLNYLYHSRVEIKGREIKKKCLHCSIFKNLSDFPLRLSEWWSPDLVLFPWMTHDTCVRCLREKEKEKKVEERIVDLQTCLCMIAFHNRVADAPVYVFARKQLEKQKNKCAKPGCDHPLRFSSLEPVLTSSGYEFEKERAVFINGEWGHLGCCRKEEVLVGGDKESEEVIQDQNQYLTRYIQGWVRVRDGLGFAGQNHKLPRSF